MKYNLKNTDNIQKFKDLIKKAKDDISELQELITTFENELETITSNKRTKEQCIFNSNTSTVISGVRNFAEYIHKSPTTALKILHSEVLQDNGIAYQVGHTWNIDKNRLDNLLLQDPQILKC